MSFIDWDKEYLNNNISIEDYKYGEIYGVL